MRNRVIGLQMVWTGKSKYTRLFSVPHTRLVVFSRVEKYLCKQFITTVMCQKS